MSWRGLLAGLLGALLSATAGAAQSLDLGRTAYMQGEYARAFEILKPLAEKGDPKAAYILGRQYQLGQGVSRDLGEAWYWYRRAEAKGHVEASLFRHLLVTRWKISVADRTRGEAKFAALARTTARAVARIRLRPSPRPTPAVSPPASLPRSVTVSNLPKVEIRPRPQPAAKTTTDAPPSRPGQPERKPTVAARRPACPHCRPDDTEPEMTDNRPQRANNPAPDPYAPRRRERAETPLEEDSGPPRQTWREEGFYTPPPAAVFPAPRYWRRWPAPVWRRPGWRTRMRWRRFRPGYTRRWRFRGRRRF